MCCRKSSIKKYKQDKLRKAVYISNLTTHKIMPPKMHMILLTKPKRFFSVSFKRNHPIPKWKKSELLLIQKNLSCHVLKFLSDVYWWTPEWCAQGGSINTRTIQLWRVSWWWKGPVLFYFQHVVGAQRNHKSHLSTPIEKGQFPHDLWHPQVMGRALTIWDPHLLQTQYWNTWKVISCLFGITQYCQAWDSQYATNW